MARRDPSAARRRTSPSQVRLLDTPDGPGRTTATLLASLAARLSALHVVTGADAVGSLVAGFARLGREVAETAEGARLRRALGALPCTVNGEAVWSALRIGEWASALPPGPLLDHLRNDLALLLADDLEETLEFMPIPAQPAGEAAAPPEPAGFLDVVLGLWAFSTEIVRSVELLAAPALDPPGTVDRGRPPPEPPAGPLLR